MVAILFLVLLTGISAAETNDCNYKIEILLNSSIYAPSDFAWKMKATKISGVSTNITSAAKIEDSGGKIIKTYRPWASDPISKQKTSGEYSPNLKEGQYKLTSEISVDCNDIDKSNNIDSENFEVVSALNENKIDLKKSDVKKVEAAFPQYTLVEISAKKGTNIDKFYESLFKVVILESFTPSAGFSVYCVTVGPILTSDISTWISKFCKVF